MVWSQCGERPMVTMPLASLALAGAGAGSEAGGSLPANLFSDDEWI